MRKKRIKQFAKKRVLGVGRGRGREKNIIVKSQTILYVRFINIDDTFKCTECFISLL